MKVWYYINKKGEKKGSTNEQKIIAMAEQNYSKVYETTIEHFDGHLLGSEFN